MSTSCPPFRRRGYALVLVLGIMALCIVILLAFLTQTKTDRAASAVYQASVAARQLGDVAVGVVQGQIGDATTQGYDTAWASQPGMIRTFGSNGNLKRAYKLYSAPDMISASGDVSGDLAPDTWQGAPAVWTDLNAPVTANGVQNFPIMDPSAQNAIGSVPAVEGFKIRGAPGAAGDTSKAYIPVRWLYVLQDGSLVAPAAASTGNTAVITGATKDNPIVGRVAFWTDDDTTKVNINTAGEGTFWDIPRGWTATETTFAYCQPYNGEYQRYPGHPATVSLSTVLPKLAGFDGSTATAPSDLKLNSKTYISLTPNYNFGGSEAATVNLPPLGTPAVPVPPKSERLYASVDEFLFKADRTDNSPLLSKNVLESRRFFLTAHSRAPETNLSNLPRVAIWPIQQLGSADWDKRTSAFDKLIAFCASVPSANGSQPYFFQRAKAYDPDYDLLGIPRNMELYSYLQYLTSKPVPGFGGTFSSKYSFAKERDEILTQLFDYVRCANIYDAQLDQGNTPGIYTFTKAWGSVHSSSVGHGWAAPVHGPNGTMGQGRYHTLKQLSILFFCCADNSNTESIDPTKNKMLNEPFPSGPPMVLGPDDVRIQAVVVPEFCTTMPGYRMPFPDLTVQIDGLNSFTVDSGKALNFPASASLPLNVNPQGITGQSFLGSDLYYSWAFANTASPFPSSMPVASGLSGGLPIYPFVSAPVTVNYLNFRLNQGKAVVKVFSGTGPAAKLIQTFSITFPAQNLKPPVLAATSSNHLWSAFRGAISGTNGTIYGRTEGKSYATGAGAPSSLDITKDVIRGMIPKNYDRRISSATIDDSANPLFVPHPKYAQSALSPQGVLMKGSGGDPGRKILLSGTAGTAAISSYDNAFDTPDRTGDFDFQFGNEGVGDYCNKPDDGDFFRGDVGDSASTDPDKIHAPDGYAIPYYSWNRQQVGSSANFSPNRIMPSAVMFGSLPSGVMERKSWQTLLFRPLAQMEAGHKGATAPHDDLLLDLFWMPVVEPYAISDRLSTAGKININYQIQPFTYIERSTGLRAVLKAEKVTRIGNTVNGPGRFNSGSTFSGNPFTPEQRFKINANETLKQFQERFDQADKNKNLFVSASEICEQYLIPEGSTYSTKSAAATDWNAFRLTGDNLRERPYATIYPRLTTKSNTFTVHFRAQSLKKVPGGDPAVWREGIDVITGEYRGSTTIERFINPDATIPNYASDPSAIPSLPVFDKFYRWRVIENTQFAP